MRAHVCWFALPFLFACPRDAGDGAVEDPGGEDLTVVVEADKSQILLQEEKLKESQSSLEKERDRLTKAREDVLGKISSLSKKDRKQRKELEAEQARLAKEEEKLRNQAANYGKKRDELERKKTELIERITALTTGEGGGNKVIVARIGAVEKRQREILETQQKNTELLNEILAAVKSIDGGGTRTVVHTSAPPSGGPSSSKGQVVRLEANIRAKMKAKGVLVADLPPAARDARSAGQKAMEQRDWSTAHDQFTQLEAVVSNIKVGHTFVQAKFGRINKEYEGKMKELNAKKKSQVLALLDDVSDSFSDGRYDKANRKINQIHSLLEGR